MSRASEFDALVAAHRHDVARVCVSILRDEHLGADAAQEAFVRVWKRLSDGARVERTRAWIRRIAVTAALDVSRARSARPAEPLADDARAAFGAPEHTLAQAELVASYRAALAELPERQRTIFLLRHDGELALAEVAEALGLEVTTVKTQFARAALKLQAKLARFRPDRGDA